MLYEYAFRLTITTVYVVVPGDKDTTFNSVIKGKTLEAKAVKYLAFLG